MKHIKYTKELLAPIVADSKSYAEIIRRLGIKQGGGTQRLLIERIKDYELSTLHFLGTRRNSGLEHTGGSRKLHWTEVLIFNRRNGRKETTNRLRRAMIESGIPYVCDECGCSPEWRGRLLVLEINHKNGDNRDNQKNNVQFICPNCHSQTENFRSKNIGRVVKLAKALPSEGRDFVGSTPTSATNFARVVELIDTPALEAGSGNRVRV